MHERRRPNHYKRLSWPDKVETIYSDWCSQHFVSNMQVSLKIKHLHAQCTAIYIRYVLAQAFAGRTYNKSNPNPVVDHTLSQSSCHHEVQMLRVVISRNAPDVDMSICRVLYVVEVTYESRQLTRARYTEGVKEEQRQKTTFWEGARPRFSRAQTDPVDRTVRCMNCVDTVCDAASVPSSD